MKRIAVIFSVLGAAIISIILFLALADFSGGENSLYFSGIVVQLFKYKFSGTSDNLQDILAITAYFTCVIAGYLLGSVNFALLISKYVHNQDIRRFGSKNAGMTNMLRVYGKKSGLLTLLGDIVKTALPIFIGRLLCGEEGAYIAALFCILGHVAPVYYRFKGGKGVVSSAIAVLLLDWQIFLIIFAVFAIIVGISRYVSLGSVFAGFLYPGVVWIAAVVRYGSDSAPPLSAALFSVFVGLFIIFNHRTNLKRFYYGEENKLSFKKKKEE